MATQIWLLLLGLNFALFHKSYAFPKNNYGDAEGVNIRGWMSKRAPEEWEEYALTGRMKSQILADHNKVRSDLEDAADMTKMWWNVSVASSAAQWVENCKFLHEDQDKYGENIYYTTKANISYAVAEAPLKWAAEKKKWNYDDGYSSDTGHFLQIIDTRSRYVGCAAKICQSGRRGTIVVCRYYPPGNLAGSRPYTKGRPCSLCQNKPKICIDRLCLF